MTIEMRISSEKARLFRKRSPKWKQRNAAVQSGTRKIDSAARSIRRFYTARHQLRSGELLSQAFPVYDTGPWPAGLPIMAGPFGSGYIILDLKKTQQRHVRAFVHAGGWADCGNWRIWDSRGTWRWKAASGILVLIPGRAGSHRLANRIRPQMGDDCTAFPVNVSIPISAISAGINPCRDQRIFCRPALADTGYRD